MTETERQTSPTEPPSESLELSLKTFAQDPLGALSEIEARFDEIEDTVQAFLPEEGRFERLRRQARALSEAYPAERERPPLFALPVGVKDIFRVDGFATGAGSKLPEPLFAGTEAESVQRLRRAGALILGKTVTTEFAYFGPGKTRNPVDAAHTPGGSSSGSAAAVGAGLCPLALGTQTIGSIVRPAAFCGVAGFKPSYDRTSREGVIPLSPSLDHVGFFAPSVRGVATVASVLCPGWRSPEDGPNDGAGRAPRLGVPEGPYLDRLAEGSARAFLRTRIQLADQGIEVLSVPAMVDFGEIVERHDLIVAAEAARVHAEWFRLHRELYHPKTAELIEHGETISDDDLATALQGREKLRDELQGLMGQAGIDLWLAPSALGPAPSGLESTGNPVMNLPWTHAGLPAVGLPAGHVPPMDESQAPLPLGAQLIGRWHGDERLLAWAADLEPLLAGGKAVAR